MLRSAGGRLIQDKTFFFGSFDYTRQNRVTALSPSLPAFVLEDGSLTYTGEYRQKLFNARVDHKLTPNQSVMFRFNLDHMFDTNPNDAVINTTAPSAGRRYSRRGWSTQVNHTSVLSLTLLNEARVSYTNGDPVTLWEPIHAQAIYRRWPRRPCRSIGDSGSPSLRPSTAALDTTWARETSCPPRRQHQAAHDRRLRQQAWPGCSHCNSSVGPSASLPFTS